MPPWGSCVDSCSGRLRHAPPTSASVHWAHNPQKALADWGAASNLFYTMGDTRLLSSLPWRKAFSDYIINRNNNEEKKANNNSPGYLWLFCASLGTWELPALSRIVVSSRRYRNLISRGANSLRPSLGCTCFRLDQLLASAS